MTRRIAALTAAALLALPLAACENTIEGIEQDTQENVDELDQQLEDE